MRPEILQKLNELTSDLYDEQFPMPAVGQAAPPPRQLLANPMVQEILQILQDDPFMIQPTLYRLKDLQARANAARLREVFTPEEYEAIRQRALAAEQGK